jgi:high-affinity nickel permease
VSGLAPVAVYVSAFLIGLLGLLWLVSSVLKWTGAAKMGIAFAAVTSICVGYLAIEKFVGVHYTAGFYWAVALMLAVGVGAGLALRRSR